MTVNAVIGGRSCRTGCSFIPWLGLRQGILFPWRAGTTFVLDGGRGDHWRRRPRSSVHPPMWRQPARGRSSRRGPKGMPKQFVDIDDLARLVAQAPRFSAQGRSRHPGPRFRVGRLRRPLEGSQPPSCLEADGSEGHRQGGGLTCRPRQGPQGRGTRLGKVRLSGAGRRCRLLLFGATSTAAQPPNQFKFEALDPGLCLWSPSKRFP